MNSAQFSLVDVCKIQSDFVPYDIAVELNKLGFDKYCMATIDQTGFFHIKNTPYPVRGAMVYFEENCPTKRQVFTWFTEKHNLFSYIDRTGGKDKFDYEFFIDTENQFFGYVSYEETELECIKRLIKIVKGNV